MDGGGIPTPPNEEHAKPHSSRRGHSSSKMSKNSHAHRTAKRPSPHAHHPHPQTPSHDGHGSGDGKHKRVWKACERCRMKKTKCDGEFPCKRCKDDGLVCTAGTRKKVEYKQLPRGYAEVLENTQFALIATVHKLYGMVRSGQAWDLGEPDLNDRGQPVIHNIASKLGCIRPNSDLDLPVHSVFPEDEAGLAELARQLEEQQHDAAGARHETESSCNQTDRASSSDLDHSDFEQDYRRAAFGGGRGEGSMTMSPQSSSLSYPDFDVASDGFAPHNQHRSPAMAMAYSQWAGSRPSSMDYARQQQQTAVQPPMGGYVDVDLLSQGLLESNFGTIKPHVISCPNPEVMMGMGDPMIFSGYDAESLRL